MSRVFRSSKKAVASLYLEEEAASLIGDERHFVTADTRGVTIRGPMSMVATSESIRKGGLFVGLNDFVEMIPSTIISPLPKNIPIPPVYMLVGIATTVAFFTAMLV